MTGPVRYAQVRQQHRKTSMPLPEIRPFVAADHAAARALWQRTPGVGLSDADEAPAIEAFLRRNPGLSHVALQGGQLVGTILCGHDGRRGLIHHLVTAPDHRRQGLGRALLHQGLRGLQEAGIDKCHLMVFRDNAEGLAFWRRVGAQERIELGLYSMLTRSAENP
jgi:ribosomal protein S18 acetylase RimI-like enzyme